MRKLLEREKELVNGVQLRTGYRVYLCLLKLRAASVKDVQKSMDFPTTAQAKYHLKKLVDLGLAKADEDVYRATGKRFGLLRFFFTVRHSILPISLFYSVFFGILTAMLFLRSPSVEILLLGGLITSKEVADTYVFYAMV